MPAEVSRGQIMMLRPSLDGFPDYPLPHPFTLRWYQPGDEQQWLAMKARADHYHRADLDYYQQTYGAHAHLLPDRQVFLCSGAGRSIGTATAWFEDLEGRQYGRVNWVLIIPEAQGCGLAKPLMSAIVRRMIELGHSSALLYSRPERLPAVQLYQHFGFVPAIRDAADLNAWEQVNARLRRPFNRAEYLEIQPG